LVGKKTKKIDFSVKRDESILFHNGIMFSPRGEFSDTQIISRGLKNLESLEQYITSNRFLIQNFDEDVFLGTWHDVDGMKYSNMSYHIKYEKTLKYASWEKDIVAESYEGYSVSKYSDEFLMSEICPKCSSDLTEVIDVATMTHECLDCETIFNLDGETYCFEDDFKDDFEEIA
jgi:hypothetical protein